MAQENYGAIFPGQGSQSVGMGKFLYENFKTAKALFEEASDTLNLDFKKLCFDGPIEALTLTENTQPALLLVSSCLYKTLQENTDFLPKAAAGHSLGEYSALVAAECVSFSDALKSVRLRGQAMQSACPVGEGGMAAILGLEDQEVVKMCEWAEKQSSRTGPLRAANFNSPGQVVISGSQKTLDWLKANYTPEGSGIGKRLKMIPLNVSAPFHSPLMKPAQDKMSEVLKTVPFSPPKFPIVQNTTAKESSNVEVLKREIIEQVSAPVKWSQSVLRLKELGLSTFVEFGPGQVLAGLVKKTAGDSIKVINLNNLEDFKLLEAQLKA